MLCLHLDLTQNNIDVNCNLKIIKKSGHIQAETAVESWGEQNRAVGLMKVTGLLVGVRKPRKKGLGDFKVREEDCVDGFPERFLTLCPSIKAQLSISPSEPVVGVPIQEDMVW